MNSVQALLLIHLAPAGSQVIRANEAWLEIHPDGGSGLSIPGVHFLKLESIMPGQLGMTPSKSRSSSENSLRLRI
jgi:hypothetical protein